MKPTAPDDPLDLDEYLKQLDESQQGAGRLAEAEAGFASVPLTHARGIAAAYNRVLCLIALKRPGPAAEAALAARCRDLGYPRAQIKRLVDEAGPNELRITFDVPVGSAGRS